MKPNDLDAYWMPFTANRQFKKAPRMLVAAEGMHYRSDDDRRILDGTSGLWCVNAGHGRREIVRAVQEQVAKLDYAPSFQMGHPLAFEAASQLRALLPDPLGHVFFTNSGSESVDTAMKIALAYHRARGECARTRFVGRERGYHGVGFGGISVGGIPANRRQFAALLPGVDHLQHTHNLKENAFSRGQPRWGAHLADELERLVALHDASAIAAVIVEPMAGSTGVLLPPKGYLDRLREICTRHGILLIFDEVITGFSRLGGHAFAAQKFGVVPDMITMAKALTNGTIPMGAVAVSEAIFDTFMTRGDESAIELFHGYTYSGHPVACAAAIASIELYRSEDLFARAQMLVPQFEDAAHDMRGAPHVIDVRSMGLVAGIELAPREGQPGARAHEAFVRCFEQGTLVRVTGDTIALSPPLIVSKAQIDELFSAVRLALCSVA